MNCTKCDGEGKIANTETGEPWSMWESLPPGADAAVRMGLVAPIKCPRCGGTGRDDGPKVIDLDNHMLEGEMS